MVGIGENSLHHDLVETAVHGTNLPQSVVNACFAILDGCRCRCHYPFHELPTPTRRERLVAFLWGVWMFLSRTRPQAWSWTPLRVKQTHAIACCRGDRTGEQIEAVIHER